MNNLLMQKQAPQMGGAPAAQPGAPDPGSIAPEMVAQARNDTKVMMAGLMKLATAPKGALTKQSVFDAAADMIGQGAFATPQAKQALVAELAQMPDDDAGIRQVVGQHLMFLAHAQDRISHHYGSGE